MRRGATLAGLVAAVLAATVSPSARAQDDAPRGARVVAALPTEGRVGLLHLYGMRHDGRAFDASEGLRLWEEWDLVLFRIDSVRPEEIAGFVVCNEAAREDGNPDSGIERVCSTPGIPLPEPGLAAAAAGAVLMAGLAARRRS